MSVLQGSTRTSVDSVELRNFDHQRRTTSYPEGNFMEPQHPVDGTPEVHITFGDYSVNGNDDNDPQDESLQTQL